MNINVELMIGYQSQLVRINSNMGDWYKHNTYMGDRMGTNTTRIWTIAAHAYGQTPHAYTHMGINTSR